MFALGGENRRVRVTALDQRYNNKQANVVRDFFARRGVGDISQVKKADLSKWGIMQRIMMRGDDLQHSDFELRVLFCVRFFVRTFVNDLARCSHLEHGTIFAISHFCIAREGQSWQFDHPKPDMVLQRNEMRNLVCVSANYLSSVFAAFSLFYIYLVTPHLNLHFPSLMCLLSFVLSSLPRVGGRYWTMK